MSFRRDFENTEEKDPSQQQQQKQQQQLDRPQDQARFDPEQREAKKVRKRSNVAASDEIEQSFSNKKVRNCPEAHRCLTCGQTFQLSQDLLDHLSGSRLSFRKKTSLDFLTIIF